MAEALLGFVTEAVLSKAFSLAGEQISLLLGVREDLQRLAEKVGTIEAFLKDAATKHINDTSIELWLKKLQAVASDADNLLDGYGYEVLRQNIEKRKREKVRDFFSPSSNPLVFRFKIAEKIKKIMLSLEEIREQANLIGLRPVEILNFSTDDPSKVRIKTDPFVDESDIVGRSDFVSKVVNQLTSSSDEEDLSVVGIVGMPGQGKTTVAQLIYKNETVVRHFEKKMWLCVSTDFNIERILNDMLQSLTGSVSQLTLREAIVKKLNEELKGKRFLLVLDDVWAEDKHTWDCMKRCLRQIGGSKGSRIVVTTRSEGVISTMQGFQFALGVLPANDSWKLFDKIAFAKGGPIRTDELVKIGEKIVERCGGLPLAIKAIGSVMQSKKDELGWSQIEEISNNWGSIDALDRVLSVIRLSFDHLPSLSLKQCFAYCCLFPKDSVMERKQLVQLWMAQGLLYPSKQSILQMEDIGNNYFNILLQRSLLQDAEFDEYGQIKSCKMHDLVHEFAVKASKRCCMIVKDGKLNQSTECVHLSIAVDEGDDIPWRNFQKLRSLFLVGGTGILPDVVQHCKYLNVLVVRDWDVRELPSSIAELKHLRYLDISGTSIKRLPNAITRLYNLQTLRLPTVKLLPKNFGNLISLRHLHVEDVDYLCWSARDKLLLGRIRQMTALQTLPFFAASQDRGCGIEELGYLGNLEGEVRIWSLENVGNHDAAVKAKLSSKTNIVSLELCWKDDNESAREEGNGDEEVLEGLKPHSNLKDLKIQGFAGKKLPSWMVSKIKPLLLRNLVSLKLQGLRRCEQIPPLGHLSNLKLLEISGMDGVKRISTEFYARENADEASGSPSAPIVAFPSLKELKISSMAGLEEWCDAEVPQLRSHSSSSIEVEVLPHLELFEIVGCPRLSCLPSNLGGLASPKTFSMSACDDLRRVPPLQALVIEDCPKLCALPDWVGATGTSLQVLIVTLNSALWMESLPLYSLTNLRELVLDFPEEDDSGLDYVPWPTAASKTEGDGSQQYQPCVSLEVLVVLGMSKLKSLPQQIQYFAALRTLVIINFDRLEALREWLGNIESLEILELEDCANLACFPTAEAMQSLTNLRQLTISGCPILKERCKKGSGTEWHKIAHIPCIVIDLVPAQWLN